MTTSLWQETAGDGPIVAFAIHAGHELRDDVRPCMALPDDVRLREEDPFTDRWTEIVPRRIVPRFSRFQVDLNRPRDSAVYLHPDQSWGLEVWSGTPPVAMVERSLEEHDRFYANARRVLDELVERHGRFVVLDLHSYNHRRDGAAAPPADPRHNPEINLGTGTMERGRWNSIVDRFVSDLRAAPTGPFDVRENVRFRGGYLSRWVHQHYPVNGCALAIEVKKVFMDEWTGERDDAHMNRIGQALASTVPGILEELASS